MIHYDRRRQSLAAALAALAGYVDAIGFVKLGGLFVSFMSGNTTRMAVGLAGGSAVAAVAVADACCRARFRAGVAVPVSRFSPPLRCPRTNQALHMCNIGYARPFPATSANHASHASIISRHYGECEQSLTC